ncbi:MAG TPA: hypothetical protein PLA47_05800 [Candidatus Syntrophosphaera thermopropionivorans]|nr:hypothetical protein [Candidatus Syntrophosphaera thermopropionivorans]
MKKKAFSVLLVFLVLLPLMAVDDVVVNLDGSTSDHNFKVKDNSSPQNNLFQVSGDGNVLIGPSKYLNFGSTAGTNGYGFRDNAGTMEYKNSGGSWTTWTTPVNSPYEFPSSAYSYGEISYNHGPYDANQTTVTIGVTGDNYASILPCTVHSVPPNIPSPYSSISTNGVSVINNTSGLPIYLKINDPGTYRVSASFSIQGINSASYEIEVFHKVSSEIPTSWVTGVDDIESLSTVFDVTQGKYASGSVTGIFTFSENDYIALCGRKLGGNKQTENVLCINLNVQRIK